MKITKILELNEPLNENQERWKTIGEYSRNNEFKNCSVRYIAKTIKNETAKFRENRKPKYLKIGSNKKKTETPMDLYGFLFPGCYAVSLNGGLDAGFLHNLIGFMELAYQIEQ